MIKPCGLDVTMTSLAKIKGKAVSMSDVKKMLIERFCQNFKLMDQ